MYCFCLVVVGQRKVVFLKIKGCYNSPLTHIFENLINIQPKELQNDKHKEEYFLILIPFSSSNVIVYYDIGYYNINFIRFIMI